MLEESALLIPAGWYPDPLGSPKRRWWDGEAWTQHAAPIGHPSISHDRERPRGYPATGSTRSGKMGSGFLGSDAVGSRIPGTNADFARQSRRDAITERVGGAARTVPPAEAERAYVPMALNNQVPFRGLQGPTTSCTLAAWMIAFMPAIELVAVLMLIFGLSNFGQFVQTGVGLIFFLCTVGLASRDRRRLITAGHTETASPWWLLLSPLAYLIARTIQVHRQTGRGSAPLWAYLIFAVVPAFVAIVFVVRADMMHVVAAAAAQ